MTAPRIAIIGSNGLLGQHLTSVFSAESSSQLILADLHPRSFVAEPKQGSYVSLDITNRNAVKEFMLKHLPEIVINCAAMNDVDGCETDRETAWKINVKGVEHIIDGCRTVDAWLIHFSSDYVFDGKHGPYTERDKPNPLSYYGKTKLASENACRLGGIRFTIVRTMVLYGLGEKIRENFPLWVINNLSRGKQINIVTDQIGNPTPADELATAVLRLTERRREGIYHIAGPDIISRFECAREIARIFELDANNIRPVTTESLAQKAPRPLNSGFITLKAESELGIRLSTIAEGIGTLKREMERAKNAHQIN
ncbi:MAG TPA: dTDP-4-dehydrorhamnose reductase [Candidatus Kapabacteria bacterium]|nr:dTDP-4-dehydrorhamnose reductase [Candidatus Kapabacteria bacterium]